MRCAVWPNGDTWIDEYSDLGLDAHRNQMGLSDDCIVTVIPDMEQDEAEEYLLTLI